MENDVLLKVEHLKQYFGKNAYRAVDGISFDIKKGEVFGLVGESGCGKTTTGRSIIGLNQITGGKIWFDGTLVNAGPLEFENDIKIARALAKNGGISKEDFAARIAKNKDGLAEVKRFKKRGGFDTRMQMIYQDPVSSLDPRMTVREIIAEGLRIQGETDAVIGQKVGEALVRVGLLPEYADRYPHEFSGGQRQRIGIARAIIMRPSLIIADEIVSALDVSIKAQVINLLNELRRQMNLTILFIAHDLSVVKYFSDRIAVMYYGKIVEMAPSDELFAHPMHPYTRALLSAIPLPDPAYERRRKRFVYDPEKDHNYSKELPVMREVVPGHFVRCNKPEMESFLVQYGGSNA